MNIVKKKNNDTLTIKVEGRINSATAPELESAVKGGIGQCNELIFDFENLDYISSAGLRILLGAQKIMKEKGKMRVINVKDAVNDIFEVTGFSYILTIER